MLNEFYRIAFRKKIFATIGELQKDLDAWTIEYNEERSHQGRYLDLSQKSGELF